MNDVFLGCPGLIQYIDSEQIAGDVRKAEVKTNLQLLSSRCIDVKMIDGFLTIPIKMDMNEQVTVT
jgi:hypothetical protein